MYIHTQMKMHAEMLVSNPPRKKALKAHARLAQKIRNLKNPYIYMSVCVCILHNTERLVDGKWEREGEMLDSKDCKLQKKKKLA